MVEFHLSGCLSICDYLPGNSLEKTALPDGKEHIPDALLHSIEHAGVIESSMLDRRGGDSVGWADVWWPPKPRTFASELPKVPHQQMHSQLLCGPGFYPQGNKYRQGRHLGIQSSVSRQSRVQGDLPRRRAGRSRGEEWGCQTVTGFCLLFTLCVILEHNSIHLTGLSWDSNMMRHVKCWAGYVAHDECSMNMSSHFATRTILLIKE